MQPIELTLSCSYTTAVQPTRRVCEVASMFGLGVGRQRTIAVVPQITLPITPASIVFITGASGGGKSTLLRLIGEQLRQRADVRVVEFGGGAWRGASCGVRDAENAVLHNAFRISQAAGRNPHSAIVEVIGGREPHGATLEQAVRWLSLAGLNDAFVMLRKVGELSDGQRYRFALACAMAEAETERDEGTEGRRDEGEEKMQTAGAIHCPRREDEQLTVVLADEFGSTLDRVTAKVVARNVRKWVSRGLRPASCGLRDAECGVRDAGCGVRDAGNAASQAAGRKPHSASRTPHTPSGGAICFIAATAHDDLLEHLEPDVLVVQEPGEGIGVHLRERMGGAD